MQIANKLRLRLTELIAVGVVILAIGAVVLATILAVSWSADLVAQNEQVNALIRRFAA